MRTDSWQLCAHGGKVYMRTTDYISDHMNRKNTYSRTLILAIAVLLSLGMAQQAAAATYYVDPAGGSDGSVGSTDAPWGTVAHAVAAAENGSTILLRTGDYGEVYLDGVSSNRTSWDQSLIVMPQSGHSPVFDRLVLRNMQNTYIEFRQLTITVPEGQSSGDACWIRDCSHVKVVDCTISGTFGEASATTTNHGVSVEGRNRTVSDVTIDGCEVFKANYGIYFSGTVRSDIVARNNDVHTIYGTYITASTDGLNEEIVFEYNHLHDRVTGDMHGSGFSCRAPSLTIRGNIIRDFGGSGGIRFYTDVGLYFSNMLIENNLIYGQDVSAYLSCSWMENNVIIRNNTLVSQWKTYPPTSGLYRYLGGAFFGLAPEGGSDIYIHNNVVVGIVTMTADLMRVVNEDNNLFWAFKNSDVYFGSGLGEHTRVCVDPNGFRAPFTTTYFEMPDAFFAGTEDDFSTAVFNAASPSVYMPNAFRLAESSLGIGTQASAYASAIDLGRAQRDSMPDIGCYEFDSDYVGNHAPVLEPVDDQTVAPGAMLSFTVAANDEDDDELTYSATGLPAGATFAGRTFSWTPTDAQIGVYDVTFVVSDGWSEDSQTITIVASNGNLPPILASIGAKSATEGQLLSFSISATDNDGDTLSYSATGLPTGASLSGRDFRWTPGYDQAGSHQVTFIASDGQAQDSETVTITVANVNRAPTLTSVPDQDVDQDSLLTIDLGATDPDGDALTYTATGVPAGASFTGGVFTWTPTASQIGTYDITFVVSDGQLQDSETATLTVVSTTPDGTPPTVAMTSPEPDSIQVALNHLVRLHITDAGRGVDPETVTIRINDQAVYQGDKDLHTSDLGRCSRTGDRYDYRYIFQAGELFRPDRVTTVAVSAADRQGNVMPTYTYAFLTEMRSFGSNFPVSAAGTGPSGHSATATDSTGRVWAVWHTGAAGARTIYVANLPVGGEAFSSPVAVSIGAEDAVNPDIAIAPDGRLYVVWQAYADGTWDIQLSTSSNGTDWTRPTAVTHSSGNATRPVVVVDSQSPPRAYVAWQDDLNGNAEIYVATSTNVFSESTLARVTANSADQSDPAIAVDDSDNVVLVWTDMRNGHADIYGAASSQAWANVPIVSKAGSQSEPAIAIAPGSATLHIVWTDTTPGHADIYYASSDGLPSGPLAGVSIIDDTAGADQTAPTIACASDLGIFACWQDMRHAGAGGDSDLFMVDLGADSVRTNVFVGDGGTNSSQSEPGAAIDAYGYPYFVWTDGREAQASVYYAASTFIDPVALDSKLVLATDGDTVGTDPAAINSKDDVSIVIPAGVCQFDARVTIAEILNPVITPVACLGSYDFGPSGIDFDAPVTVTIPYVFAAAGGSAKPYWYDSLTGAMSQQGITDVENLVISPTLNALRFKTTHFTPFYLVAADAEVPAAEAETPAGGCSLAPNGAGSAADMILPYGCLAIVMGLLKRADRRKSRASQPQA